MNERLKIQLNCDEVLQASIPKFIEAFVAYYGEERREEIETKLSSALYIGYITPQTLSQLIHETRKAKEQELQDEMLKNSMTKLSKKDLFDSFFICENSPIEYYIKFKNLYLLQNEGRKKKYLDDTFKILKSYLPSLTREEYDEMVEKKQILEKYNILPQYYKEKLIYYLIDKNYETDYQKAFQKCTKLFNSLGLNITLEQYSLDIKEIKELDIVIEEYEKMKDKYALFEESIKTYTDLDKENKEIHRNLEKKYYNILLKNNLDLFSEKDQQNINTFIEDESSYSFLNETVSEIIGSNIIYSGLIDAFSEENDELIKNNPSSWWVDEIIKKRISYFKLLGISNSDNYEDYLNSEDIQKVWPNKERVKKYLEDKKALLSQLNKEYYNLIKSHQKIQAKYAARNNLYLDSCINENLYESSTGSTFVEPNITKDNNGQIKLSPSVVISFCSDRVIDHNIIHELNHLFELHLQVTSENDYSYICGWDVVNVKDGKEEVDNNRPRKYELFNEIINEIIAQEIANNLHSKNIYIIDDKENSKTAYTTSYENTFFIVREFYNEFKEDIIRSRSNGNMNEILNIVGEENFEQLNKLFSKFQQCFPGFNYYSLLQALHDQEDNELTRSYYEILNESRQIVDKMRQHKKELISDGYHR